MTRVMRRALAWPAAAAGAAAGGYAAWVAVAWYRYGAPALVADEERDELLDRVMPVFEVRDHHHVVVEAPAAVAMAAARDLDLQQSALVHAIFAARARVLGARDAPQAQPSGLVEQILALGWRIVEEEPGRELVFAAVTQPWFADVVFRGFPAEEFRAFRDPGYVKIVWTLRADPLTDSRCVFRTETRVATTDAESRRRFRWYWARFSAGIILIRRVLLAELKRRAERGANHG